MHKSLVVDMNLQLFAEEKTEEATPRRRQEVREKGQVPKSSDLNGAVILLVLVVLLYYLRGYFAREFKVLFVYLFHDLGGKWVNDFSDSNLHSLTAYTVLFYFRILAPVFLCAMSVGTIVNLAQVGFLYAPEIIKPKFENINPLSGFKRMFSKRALMELFKALLKVLVIGMAVYITSKNNADSLPGLFFMNVSDSFSLVAEIVFKISKNAVGAYLVIALIDYLFQRHEFKQSIMMTKQEVREEYKQTEGDPQIKSKLKEKQRQLAMHRMMESIPEATVIITNPTHLAVALKYSTADGRAPRVVAKGAGVIAERIKEMAVKYRIPVMEEKQLARFLYQNVDIGKEIPAELYLAVAEILAMLYRTGRRF